ncbi:hypothetical protein G9A89_002225 [Geosiphon pyriformis]|nr:hypothetical protein G9A89_002225 [Geosiphon pyriformis]
MQPLPPPLPSLPGEIISTPVSSAKCKMKTKKTVAHTGDNAWRKLSNAAQGVSRPPSEPALEVMDGFEFCRAVVRLNMLLRGCLYLALTA